MGSKKNKEDKNVNLEFNLDFNEDATKVDPPESTSNTANETVEKKVDSNLDITEFQIEIPKDMDGDAPTTIEKDVGKLELTDDGTAAMQKDAGEEDVELPTEMNAKANVQLALDSIAEEDTEGRQESPVDGTKEEKGLSFDSLDDMKEETADIELPAELTQNNPDKTTNDQLESTKVDDKDDKEEKNESGIKFYGGDNLEETKASAQESSDKAAGTSVDAEPDLEFVNKKEETSVDQSSAPDSPDSPSSPSPSASADEPEMIR
ncbi:MAG: hypothetical protein OXB84_03130, partial [Halobacteriovoraceae bacterium]|nr:hypothetical protein [Halobacteriovoraceae bacterium]